MLGVYVTAPIACFRKGLAREYLETELLPPPATCYGFLLALVGEKDRYKHIGVRISPVLLSRPPTSVVLRTVWRCKEANYYVDPNGKHHVVSAESKQRNAFKAWVESKGWPAPIFTVGLGAGSNARPDYQQLLTDVKFLIWIEGDELETSVMTALTNPSKISRYGGLSLGESTHLVDEVSLLDRVRDRVPKEGRAFLTAPRGRLTLPVWVDHVGSAGTRYATGNLELTPLVPPSLDLLPLISPDAEP